MADTFGVTESISVLVTRATDSATTTTIIPSIKSNFINIIPDSFFLFVTASLVTIGFIFLLFRIKGFLEDKK